jgi:hypothetical protein
MYMFYPRGKGLIVAIARKIAIKEESNVRFAHLQQTINASKEFLSDFNGPDHTSSVFL